MKGTLGLQKSCVHWQSRSLGSPNQEACLLIPPFQILDLILDSNTHNGIPELFGKHGPNVQPKVILGIKDVEGLTMVLHLLILITCNLNQLCSLNNFLNIFSLLNSYLLRHIHPKCLLNSNPCQISSYSCPFHSLLDLTKSKFISWLTQIIRLFSLSCKLKEYPSPHT